MSMKSWLKWQGLASVFISFYLLIFAAFSQTEVPRSVSIPDSLSPNSQNHTVLPIATEYTSILWQGNNNQTEIKTGTVAYKVHPLYNFKSFSQYFYASYGYPCWLNGNHRQGCQRAYQLVDIPPPPCHLS